MNSAENSILMAGLGNIGSHALRAVACDRRIDRVVLIDPDHYDESNLVGQAIERKDVGQLKVSAQAAWLRGARPDVKIDTYAEELSAVPLGIFRSADIVISGLDSRRARLELNDRVFRAGSRAWIDAGISPDGGLARTTVLRGDPAAEPDQQQPCLECGWSADDYAALEQRYLCREGNVSPPTGAPSELGRLSAEGILEALSGILDGRTEVFNRESLANLDGIPPLLTGLTRNPGCRFHHTPDATPDCVQKIALDQSVGTFFERIAPFSDCGVRVEAAGVWVRQTACVAGCGGPPVRCLNLANRPAAASCPRCGSGEMLPVGFESRPILWRDELSTERLAQSLWSAGVRRGDEITFFRSRNAAAEPILRLAVAA